MKDYNKSVVTAINLVCLFLALGFCPSAIADDFTMEAIPNFNHGGYKDTSMEEGCTLQESFDVDECSAFDGCNILDAAAAKAAFASARYLKASKAMKRASKIYKKNGYEETSTFFEEAAEVSESGHLAFASLSELDAAGVEALNVSSYDEIKEMFLHIDPIYLDACKTSAKAFASAVTTEFFIREVVEASAYNQSATAAAFRAYQFFYAGIDGANDTEGRGPGSWSAWFWEKLGY